MALSDLSQPQREALMSLLTLATYGDGHLSFAELDSFRATEESIPWDSGTSLSIFLDGATAEARAAHEAGQAAEFVTAKAEAFDSAESRSVALGYFEEILGSDGSTDNELKLLEVAKAALKG